MEIVTVDGRDPEIFRRFYAVKYAVRQEELEFPAGMGLEEARVYLAREHAGVRAEGLGLVNGDTWLGIAWLDWWLVGDTSTVDVELAVAPPYRRRGVATRLLDAAIARARSEGRTLVSGTNLAGDPVTGESPGTAFAAARGFVRKHAELHQVLELPVAGLASLRRPVPGYELIYWREHIPDEWIEQFAELLTGMSEDVPSGERTAESISWTPALIRDAEARRVAQGRFTFSTAAVHTASGQLAAYTQMGGTPETPDRLNQYDTYVRRSHRGRRLGIAVKVPNLHTLQTAVAHPAVLHTWNAPENLPMIAVNTKLGFRAVGQRTMWERPLENT